MLLSCSVMYHIQPHVMALAVNNTHKTINPMGLLRRLLEVGCGLVLLGCRPDISVIVCGICVSSRLQEQLGHVLVERSSIFPQSGQVIMFPAMLVPQKGQERALSETSCPHSGHLMIAMVMKFLRLVVG